jgi:hypothetical protein
LASVEVLPSRLETDENVWQVIYEEDGVVAEWEEAELHTDTGRVNAPSTETMATVYFMINEIREALETGCTSAQQGYAAVEIQKIQHEIEIAYLTLMTREILDSGCSTNMSDIEGRLTDLRERGGQATAANGSTMQTVGSGLNKDGLEELRVKNMAKHLVLLSLRQYASSGIFVADGQEGSVLRMPPEKAKDLLADLRSQYDEFLTVEVRGGVYEVVKRGTKRVSADHEANQVDETPSSYYSSDEFLQIEETYHAATFFNAKVVFTTTEELIVGYMLFGFSTWQLLQIVEGSLMTGIDPRLTVESIKKFQRNHGNTPDVFQASLVHVMGNMKSAQGPSMVPEYPGHYVQVDGMQYDFNRSIQGTGGARKTEKMPTYGGATGAKLAIDCRTGYFMGDLTTKGTRQEDVLMDFIRKFRLAGAPIKILSCDSGEVAQSESPVMTTQTLLLLLTEGIEFQLAEPYNHSNGNQYIENGILLIKSKMRMAFRFVFSNPNIEVLNWNDSDICQLWGEIFKWAIIIVNLTESPHVSGKSRHEAFLTYKPDAQIQRILPIFSVCLALSRVANTAEYSNQMSYVHGFYVGPQSDPPSQRASPGVIRIAVRTTTGIKILKTSKYKCVTIGGNLSIHDIVNKGLNQILTPPVENLRGDRAPTVSTGEPTVPTVPTATIVPTGVPAGPTAASVPTGMPTGPTAASVPTGMPTGPTAASVPTGMPTGEPASEDEIPVIEPAMARGEEEIRPGRMTKKLKDALLKVAAKKKAEPLNSRQEAKANKTLRRTNEQGKLIIKALRRRETEAERYQKEKPYKTGAQDRLRRMKIKELRDKLAMFVGENLLTQEEAFTMEEAITGISKGGDCDEGNLSWVDLDEGDCLYSLSEGVMYQLQDSAATRLYLQDQTKAGIKIDVVFSARENEEDGDDCAYRVVTENIPKNFMSALKHQTWGEPSKVEMDLLKSKVVLRMSAAEAQRYIAEGCDVVRLFPIYEVKTKEGKEVYKVRLVADGRSHRPDGPTYAATPSREELLILLHIIAKDDWDFYHVDESRAFTGADYTDTKPVLVKLSGDTDYWKVINALYGLKTAPLDYQKKTAARMLEMGFTRKALSNNVYIRRSASSVAIVYAYVDDYIITCDNKADLTLLIDEFQAAVRAGGTDTSAPRLNPPDVLGLELSRDHQKRVICIRMSKKILEMADKFLKEERHTRRHPMTATHYLVREDQYESLPADEQHKAAFLLAHEINQYLSLVGGLLWIAGIRFDVAYAVMYLTWYSHLPRVHHMEVGLRVLEYLVTTSDIPLVLGGFGDLKVVTYTDAALGVATRLRSVIAEFTRLGDGAGAVSAHCTATDHIMLSSYEAELTGSKAAFDANQSVTAHVDRFDLQGVTNGFKTSARVANQLREFEYPVTHCATADSGPSEYPRLIYGDNEKAIEFVNGTVEGKNVRHADLRLWYLRHELKMTSVRYEWTPGNTLDVNAMTKNVSQAEHLRFTWNVMGHALLGYEQPIVEVKTRLAEKEKL